MTLSGCNKQWRRYTRARQVKWPGWKVHRPSSSPGSALPSTAYYFASVIVWTENKNVTTSDRFILFWRWNGVGGLCSCVLRAITKKGCQLFLRKTCIRWPGWRIFDLKMTWLLHCAGAATATGNKQYQQQMSVSVDSVVGQAGRLLRLRRHQSLCVLTLSVTDWTFTWQISVSLLVWSRSCSIGVEVARWPRSGSIGVEVARWPRSGSIGVEVARWPRSCSIGVEVARWPRSCSIGVDCAYLFYLKQFSARSIGVCKL